MEVPRSVLIYRSQDIVGYWGPREVGTVRFSEVATGSSYLDLFGSRSRLGILIYEIGIGLNGYKRDID